MADDIVEIYSGSDAQPLQDQIKVGGRPFDLGPATTVKFQMRQAQSDDLKVDATATVENEDTGQVSYDWIDTDLDTPGEYFGWWKLTLIDGDLTTSEFPVIILEHSPGYRTRHGAIYRSARGIIPITWDALEKSSNYGDSLLQERIETVKLTVFGAQVAVDDEASYDIRIIEFIAKLVAIQVIPAGVDYWLSQHETFTATGVQETASYPDRVKALWEIYAKLQAQIVEDREIIDELLDVTTNTRPLIGVPEASAGAEEGFKTPLPVKYFPDYAFPSKPNFEDWL